MEACQINICLMNRNTTNRPSCYQNGSLALKRLLNEKLSSEKIEIKTAMCFGLCDRGPIVKLNKGSQQEVTLVQANLESVQHSLKELCLD